MATNIPVIPKSIGTRVKRREDPRLITGQATYVDDLRLPGMLYLNVLRSMYAHAKLGKIDTSKHNFRPEALPDALELDRRLRQRAPGRGRRPRGNPRSG